MTKSDPNELKKDSEEKQGAKQKVYFGGMLLSSRRKRRGLPPLIPGQETAPLIGIGLMNKAFDKEMREYLKDTPFLTPSGIG